MKPTTFCLTLAFLGLTLPSAAQTKSAPHDAHQSASSPSMMDAIQNLRNVSGPRPRTPEQKAQEAARLDRINDLVQAGKEALHAKNFAMAEEDYRQLVQDHTLGPFPYYGLGEALAGEGKTASALAVYKTAVYWPLNTGPEGIAFSRAIGNPSNLSGCCGPTDAVAWMKYALLLSQTGQNEEACSVYSEAVRHAPDTAHPAINRSFEGSLPSPVELQAAAHIALGLLVNDTGNDRELAMSEFEQAQKLAPDAAVTNFYYGYGWQRLDLQSKTRLADAPQAKAALQKAALADDENVKKAASEALRGWR